MAAGELLEDGLDAILEPLSFTEQGAGPSASALLLCPLCPEHCPPQQTDRLLKHLLQLHHLVIADVALVADLPKYLQYWKGRFLEQPVTHFCSVIKTNSTGPPEKQEDYFLLCDILPEDRLLREKLQQRRLEEVLEQQQSERDDTSFHRVCLFCSQEFTGNRSSLLNHMAREHSFSIGLPDNIVHCHAFLDLLQSKLDSLQCLYCEKTFRDQSTLKDHMRKKGHRRINSTNHQYDQFYIINYLELGKTWTEVQSEDDRELLDDRDDDWSDWQAQPLSAVCLFCDHLSLTMELVYTHMQHAHGFDLEKLRTELGLSFYQQVKLVNFIRRQVHQRRCCGCQQQFESRAAALQHLCSSGHASKLADARMWDQPQYYFPTYENDALLCSLTDSDGEGAGRGEELPVIAEDVSSLQELKQTSTLKQLLRTRAEPRGEEPRPRPRPPEQATGTGKEV